MRLRKFLTVAMAVAAAPLFLMACAQGNYPPAPKHAEATEASPEYVIGPLDKLDVFVWRSPELSTSAPVRPDGRVSLPLIEDIDAAGMTPSALARDIEERLKVFVQDPVVTVIVNDFVGSFSQQVRVVGETSQPRALPYRAGMTLLDAMIAVGGLTEFADGNRAVLVRYEDAGEKSYGVRLDDLMRDGDVSANVALLPGDVVIIPESWF